MTAVISNSFQFFFSVLTPNKLQLLVLGKKIGNSWQESNPGLLSALSTSPSKAYIEVILGSLRYLKVTYLKSQNFSLRLLSF